MAVPMDESIAVARFGDHRPSRPVDVLRRDPRADRLERGLLGRQDDRVDLALFLGGFAHEDGPSEVRAVLVAHAPEVHHDGVAGFDVDPGSWCPSAVVPAPTT